MALCTHNGARHIEEQLRSILAQSLLPAQIVVSDDASSDATVSIVESIWRATRVESRDGDISFSILRNSTALGVTANFAQALEACTGDLIALCDQDDLWHVDRLQIATERFTSSPRLSLLGADARLIDDGGAPLGYSLFDALDLSAKEKSAMHGGYGFQALLRRNLVTGATALLKRELLVVARPFPESWVHDEWLAVLAAATGSVDLLETELIDYRQHATNQIGVRKRGLIGKFRRIIEPRSDRYQYLLRRARALLERLEDLGGAVPAAYVAQARGKVEHLEFREALPAARLLRILPVLHEALTGRYNSYSRGLGDIVRDLLQGH